MKIVSNLEHDDMAEEVVQTPHVSQNIASPSTPRTLRHVLAKRTLTQVTTQAMSTSTSRGQLTVGNNEHIERGGVNMVYNFS